MREIVGSEEGAPPPVDLALERKNGDFVREQILGGSINACHDISDGGLLVALAEMTYRHGIGASVTLSDTSPAAAFGEDQARYVVCVADSAAFEAAAAKAGVSVQKLGQTGGDALEIAGQFSIKTAELRATNEAWLPAYMAG